MSIDGTVVVVHPRRLVAETLCIALRGIGLDARLESDESAAYALVDTASCADIERLVAAGTAVIAFGTAEPITIARAERAGAAWHIDDDIGFARVAEHLERLADGATSPGAIRQARPDPAFAALDTLTRREREVLRWLVSGRRAAEIAETDFVSVTTVRNQIQSILTKLGAHSQLEAVSVAVRAGWTPLAA